MAGAGAATMSPCAACKLLRRRCTRDCVFAPYFPPDEPHKFANVHKVFGAANVNKMLQELPMEARGDAVSSMVYEADARVRDPVYGCVGAISSLQHQVANLQTQLAVANAEIVCMRMHTPDRSTSDCNNAASPQWQQQGEYHQGTMSPEPLQPQSPEQSHYHYRDHYRPSTQYYHHMDDDNNNHNRDHYRASNQYYHHMDDDNNNHNRDHYRASNQYYHHMDEDNNHHHNNNTELAELLWT